ncbi:MAG TPA: class I SAM-dependent methyltransferase [Pyrinomonadaceae bacterium]|nr:class I SAM-dependent methyltransferase [Pyrinomonadaceae bacterium]
MDPLNRFSSRVQDYVRYRPGYPQEITGFLTTTCSVTPMSIIADVGSGTGIFSELLLRNGNSVFGVEPNKAMRAAAEEILRSYPNFNSIDGSAESTTLGDQSVDLITAAQAWHWFDRPLARKEFRRILRPNGWVVLVWNERRLASTDFLRDYEEVLLKHGTDYKEVRHENVEPEVASFFEPGDFQFASFDNHQHLDLDGFLGRAFSSSYTPQPGKPGYEPMVADLNKVFRTHQVHGKVTIEYDTKLFYGHLR